MAQTYVAGQGQDKATDPHTTDSHHNQNFWSLTVGSIGVVYGDIGTSPLYAFKEAMLASKEHGMDVRTSVIGILSLIIWALILIVTIKYVLILLRADNKGEGGTFALMALGQSVAKRSAPVLFALGIAGVSFFYGDAVITPAMSVLSAVEGLELVHPTFKKVVIPLTCLILVGLFAMQSRGTAKVAAYFGPITVLWFLVLALGGLMHIVDDPSVLKAFNPWPGMKFIGSHGLIGLTIMGLVFLAVTGAEALYADLGHFGRKPIQFAWLSVVLPALLLNYLGQGAMVLSDPKMLDDKLFNPFYKLYPEWALVPMIILATIATVIASQAVITGAFSLTRQAVQLGLLPRLAIKHTSENMAGQIYLPRVNWLILACVLAVVFIFGSSSRLAAAYGISVTAAMVIDSLMAFFVVWKYWKWPLWQAALVILPLALIEQAFLTANMVKVLDGGWFPIMIAGTTAMIMLTWHKGSLVLVKETRKNEADLDWLIRKLESKPPHRVPGTAVFLTSDPTAAPTALMHNLKHNRVLHERNIILSIKVADSPRLLNSERIHIDKLSDGFIRVTASFGFMETPSIPKVLTLCRKRDLNIEMAATSFFLSRRSLRPTNKSELPAWQEQLFIALAGSAQDATTYFQIPTDRVVEVGTQVAV
jgi:KUP system potassium uptake protein